MLCKKLQFLKFLSIWLFYWRSSVELQTLSCPVCSPKMADDGIWLIFVNIHSSRERFRDSWCKHSCLTAAFLQKRPTYALSAKSPLSAPCMKSHDRRLWRSQQLVPDWAILNTNYTKFGVFKNFLAFSHNFHLLFISFNIFAAQEVVNTCGLVLRL